MPFMSSRFHSPSLRFASRCLLASVVSAASCFVLPAHAEKADRAKPLNLVADNQGVFDLAKQAVVFTGNVIITKGTIVIKADRVEVRETPDGYYDAVALGTPARQATFRQKRDGVDEYIDGQADRLEYNDKADVIRFVNRAVVRRLRGNTAAGDEITGNLVTYDNTGPTPASGAAENSNGKDGRVRAVLVPRAGTAAAAEMAAQSASDAASAAPRLTPSTTLRDKP
jgi:lipopolysaccharide export system protein LptA